MNDQSDAYDIYHYETVVVEHSIDWTGLGLIAVGLLAVVLFAFLFARWVRKEQ